MTSAPTDPGGALPTDQLVDVYGQNHARSFIQRASGRGGGDGTGPHRPDPSRCEARSTGGSSSRSAMRAGQTVVTARASTGMMAASWRRRHQSCLPGETFRRRLPRYHTRWLAAFGNDFRASASAARMTYASHLPGCGMWWRNAKGSVHGRIRARTDGREAEDDVSAAKHGATLGIEVSGQFVLRCCCAPVGRRQPTRPGRLSE